MKKLSSILLMALAATPSAQSDPGAFTGFYVGGNLGWTERSDKTTFEAYDVTENFPAAGRVRVEQNAINNSNRVNGINYGLYAGYGQNYRGFYWGAEFSVADDAANKGHTHNNLKFTGNGYEDPNSNGRLYAKYHRGVVFGLTPRIGAVIANENLIYVKLGMEYSRDKIIYQWKYMMDGSPVDYYYPLAVSRKNQFVFVPGIGYERAFGKLLARVEYGYNFGAKIQSPGLIKEGLTDNRHSRATVKYSAHTLKFGLAYKF